MIQLLGLIGGLCFAYCGLPAAYATLKAGRSIGTPVSVAWMIAAGGVSMYLYLLLSYGFDPLLAVNYSIEVLSWSTIVFYNYFPRESATMRKLGKKRRA